MNLRDAAEARRGGVVERADRPAQRRSAELMGSRAVSRAALSHVELRATGEDGSGLRFNGVASATESPYDMFDEFGPYNEVISAGAFGSTLARSDLSVPLVLGHDPLRRIASTDNGTLSLQETPVGLVVGADLQADDQDVQYIAPKLRSGLISEMSFAFRIDAGAWSPDFTEFRITSVNLQRGDVSIVGYGANPATTAALRTAPERQGMSLAALELLLTD